MQKYKYVAYDVNKKKFKGSFLAQDMDDLRMQLASQKLYLVSAKPVSDSAPTSFFSVSGKAKTSELTMFCREFAIMINSGLPIIKSLDVLRGQKYSSFFKKTLDMVYEDVLAGLLLSEAMEKHKKVFPQFFTSMTYVGEKSGKLDVVLRSIADYYETDASIKKKTKSALAYPLFLTVMMIAIVILMVSFVIPTFSNNLAQMNVTMPPISLAMMSVSSWFIAYWKYLVLGIIGFIGLMIVLYKTKSGKYFFHTIVLNLPLFGRAQMSLISARFARSFGLLLNSGVEIVESMTVVSAVLGNANVQKRFALATQDVRSGSTLTAAMKKYHIFPDMLLQMIAVGEETGKVDEVLLKASTHFDEQAERAMASVTSWIQPIMLLIIGGIVGVLFYAMYAPILGMITQML